MSEPLFQALDVSYGFTPGRRLLDGLNFVINKGDFVGLIGPNGAGKSTLMSLLSGWRDPDAGEIYFEGRDIRHWSRREFARRVAIVPQREEGVFPYTAREIVMMGRFAHQNPMIGYNDQEDEAIADGALRLVGLEGFGNRVLESLSGGERQQVLLARALAQCPSAILLDEPTASLDPNHQQQTFGILEKLNRECGITIFAISHDINLAALFCERIAVLHEGHITAEGTPEEILRPDLLEPIYGARIAMVERPDGIPMVGLRK